MRSVTPAAWIHLSGTALLTAFALMYACAGREVPPAPPVATAPAPLAVPAPAQKSDDIYRETGMAAWYGRELHGKKTASGEAFDMYGLSGAHRTLPLGTVVHVTNLDNFKSITVRINDRGPFSKSRFLDLSYGAAFALGFVARGTARVQIEALDAVREPGKFTVQAAVYSEEENARMLKERLDAKYELVAIESFESNIATFYRVLVGSYASEERAEKVAGKLVLEGLEPIVVRKD